MNNELFIKVREWAAARNIINGATAISQYAKLMSEHGELAGHLVELAGLPYDGSTGERHGPKVSELEEKIMDDIGDALVVLTIICAQLDVNIEDIGPDSVNSGSEFMCLTIAYGMLADAILKRDIVSLRSLISTILALHSALAHQIGSGLEGCLAAAYEDIKDRKGVMYNGTFVKSTDVRYDEIMKELSLS